MVESMKKQIVFEANRKSVGVAYLLWLFLGGFGVHRFYAGATKSGVAQLILLISVVGWLVLLPWLIIDLFLIPGLVRERNVETLSMLGYREEQPDAEEFGPPEPPRPLTDADRRREAMLEDLRQTGYRKERRPFSETYR